MINVNNKGKAFERKIARLLKTIWPMARRGYQSRGGGKEACDVEGTPYHIECSIGSGPIMAKWGQAVQDSKICGLVPIVIKKFDGQEPIVICRLRSWLTLLTSNISDTFVPLVTSYAKEFENKNGKD